MKVKKLKEPAGPVIQWMIMILVALFSAFLGGVIIKMAFKSYEVPTLPNIVDAVIPVLAFITLLGCGMAILFFQGVLVWRRQRNLAWDRHYELRRFIVAFLDDESVDRAVTTKLEQRAVELNNLCNANIAFQKEGLKGVMPAEKLANMSRTDIRNIHESHTFHLDRRINDAATEWYNLYDLAYDGVINGRLFISLRSRKFKDYVPEKSEPTAPTERHEHD